MNVSVLPKEDGRVIAWMVVDPETAELVLICKTRSEAREIAEECCGRVAKCVSSH
jgi:hypothetical protein